MLLEFNARSRAGVGARASSGTCPQAETALIEGDLAVRQHKGGHTTGPNWPTFLAFADRYLRASGPKDQN